MIPALLIPSIIKGLSDPRVIKGIVLTAVFLCIFMAGWKAKTHFVEAEILSLKTDIETLNDNYELCYDNLRRSNANWLGLKDSVEATNEEVRKLNDEYNLKVVQLRELNRAAIDHVNATHAEAMGDMVEEANALRERMATMTAAEACHEAMLEIVK